ncbi:MAG TPA: hypothetical protein VFR29_01060 [Steroidobacteraceae bacterium]|nr:hypothetical protein [Steroidobacteraceae bacterium]
MFSSITRLAAAAALAFSFGTAMAQDSVPYTEGAVVNVSSARTEPGQFNNYMRYLAGPYRKIMDEAVKQGLVLEYSFYAAQPKNPGEPDLYLITVYPNFAAFDGLGDKMDAISNKVFGSMSAAESAEVDREKLRKLIGSELVRELKLK